MNTKFTLLLIFFAFQLSAQVSGSIEFDGNNNYIEVANSPLNTIGTGDFTFEAWVKGDESQQNTHPTIFSNRGASSIVDGVVFFYHGIWGGSNYKLLSLQIDGINHKLVNNGTYNGSLLDNQCHHVAVTRTGNLISFYADGVLFGTTTTNSSATASNSESLLIGKDLGTNNTLNGIASQIRIWDVARTEAEILANKDLILQGNEQGLVAYWEMNQGSGQIVPDKTGQYDGQLGSSNADNQFDPVWTDEGCTEFATSNDELLSSSFDVYPNPISDFITIHSENNKEIEVQLVSSTGALIRSLTITNGISSIDMSKLPTGIYLLNATSDKNTVVKKIMKK